MKHVRTLGATATVLSLLGLSAAAHADPVLRFQMDQEGDFQVIGNTLAHDCANGNPAPTVGVVGACGSNVSDQSPDVFWSSGVPAAGNATASTAITVDQARSDATLILPAGAQITYARLYWAGLRAGAVADTQVSFGRPGAALDVVTADVSYTQPGAGRVRYEATAPVTDIVQQLGVGGFRVRGVDSINLNDINDPEPFAAWSLVVFYELAGQPLRQLSVFDGLDAADSGSGVTFDITGFLVPNVGIDAKIGVIAYGSDGQTGGDSLTFNGVDLVDGLGGNDFFNSSRTFLGVPVSNAGDLPRLTGGARSMSAFELDVVDVTAQVTPGSTLATVNAKAGGDNELLLGAFVTSITTFKPNFNDSLKTATDLDGGALLAGDVVQYTVDVVNTGNDPSVNTVLEDVLPVGVTYVPDSIEILSGPNAGLKTDPTGDDQGEYDAGTRTVRLRLGTGADANVGGSLGIGESSLVSFLVTVDAGASGTLSNQATITAEGQNGAPTTSFTSTDGDGGPTDVVVDACEDDTDCADPTPACFDPPDPTLANYCVECTDDSDCGGTTPVCDLGSNTCVPCASDADCTDPNAPACHATGPLAGACTECSTSNPSLCGGNSPICLDNFGFCGCTDVDGDSECGGPNSGIICNGPAGVCVPGCSTAPNRNDCPATGFCSDQSGGVGNCINQCVDDGDCGPPTPFCDTTQAPNVCVECLDDTNCNDPLVCDVGNTNTCVECTPGNTTNCVNNPDGEACLPNGNCGCLADPDCGAIDSGRVCDTSNDLCITGCRGTGNGCPAGLECTSTDDTIGVCVVPNECDSNADCMLPTPFCDLNQDPTACVECLVDADCANPTPACEAGVCVACTSDDDCTNPAEPACQLTGELAGYCTECTSGNDSLCVGTKPLCVEELGLCGCASFDGDSECGGPNSGVICNDAGFGECVPGCSTADGRNDCPEGEYCSEQDGSEGICLEHCETDEDCTRAPFLVCDTSMLPHVCVECLEDDDCPDGVCDPSQTCVGCIDDGDCDGDLCDPETNTCVECLLDTDCDGELVCDPNTNTCVECTPQNTENCDDGLSCLEGGVCGCRTDAECPDNFVCNTNVGECVPEDNTGGAGGGEPADLAEDVVLGGGCSCRVAGDAGHEERGALTALGLAALAMLRRRRRGHAR